MPSLLLCAVPRCLHRGSLFHAYRFGNRNRRSFLHLGTHHTTLLGSIPSHNCSLLVCTGTQWICIRVSVTWGRVSSASAGVSIKVFPLQLRLLLVLFLASALEANCMAHSFPGTPLEWIQQCDFCAVYARQQVQNRLSCTTPKSSEQIKKKKKQSLKKQN